MKFGPASKGDEDHLDQDDESQYQDALQVEEGVFREWRSTEHGMFSVVPLLSQALSITEA